MVNLCRRTEGLLGSADLGSVVTSSSKNFRQSSSSPSVVFSGCSVSSTSSSSSSFDTLAFGGRAPSSSTSQEFSSELSVGKVVRRPRNESRFSDTLRCSDLE